MRIHFISAKKKQKHGTVQMRCLQPMEVLEKLGWTARFYHFTRVDLRHTPEVAVLHRLPLNRVTAALVRYYRSRNVHLIYDTDDLIFGPEAPQFQGRFEPLMRRADAIATSTEYLLHAAEHVKVPVFHHPNFLGTEFLSAAESCYAFNLERKQGNVLMFASGSHTHDADLEMIAPALARLLKERQEVRLRIVGKVDLPRTLKGNAQVEVCGFTAYSKYPKLLQGVDALLIPLRNEPFNRARSAIKYLEAAACGVSVLASPLAGFRGWEKEDPALRLVADDAWYEAIQELLNTHTDRRSQLERSRALVIQLRSPKAAASMWSELLASHCASMPALMNGDALTYRFFALLRRQRLRLRRWTPIFI